MSIPYTGSIEITYSDKVTEMASAPMGMKIKNMIIYLIGAAVLTGIFWVIGWAFEWSWLQYGSFGLGGIGAIIGIVIALRMQVAPCPYCDKQLGDGEFDGLDMADENEAKECGHCYAALVSDKGKVSAFKPENMEAAKVVVAPMFEGGKWPGECIICGGEVEHTEEAKAQSVDGAAMLVGRISVGSASIGNIPYCENHSGMVDLTIEEDYPRLIFKDLGARMRYVKVNEGKKAVKLKDD